MIQSQLAKLREKTIYRAGLERGEKENSLKIAKELLKRGMSKEEVITIVQLELRNLENIDVSIIQ